MIDIILIIVYYYKYESHSVIQKITKMEILKMTEFEQIDKQFKLVQSDKLLKSLFKNILANNFKHKIHDGINEIRPDYMLPDHFKYKFGSSKYTLVAFSVSDTIYDVCTTDRRHLIVIKYRFLRQFNILYAVVEKYIVESSKYDNKNLIDHICEYILNEPEFVHEIFKSFNT